MRAWHRDEEVSRKSDECLILQEQVANLERANAELQASEEKYHTLVNNIDIGIYRTPFDCSSSIVRANPAMARIFGYDDVSEILALPPAALYADPGEREPLIVALREGYRVKGRTVRMRRRDGTTIVCSLTFTAVRGPEGTIEFIDGAIEDITERIGMEDDLRASETKYRQLVDSALEGIWAVDQGWNTSFVNQSMAKMLGYSPEEMMGRPLVSFMDEIGRAALNQLIARRESGLNEVHDFEFLRKDGTKIYTRLSTSPFLDDQNHSAGALALVSDVTARRRAEEALRQSEERFRSLIEQAPVAIGMNHDVRLEYVNPAYAKMFGYDDAQEMKGRSIIETVAPSCREEVEGRAFHREQGLPAETEFETVGLRKDGSQFHVHGSAVRINLVDGPATVVFLTDITESKCYVDELRRSEERFRSLIEEAPVAIAMSRNGLEIYGNPGYVKMFGYERMDEMIGHLLTDRIAPSHRERTLEFALAHDRGEAMKAELETMGLRKDGTEFPFIAAVTRVLLADGPALLGFFTDITERKRAEMALQSSQQMLQLVLDNVPDRVFWKDRELNFLGANRTAARDAGLSDPKEIIGKNDHELAWRESAACYQRDDRQVIESGRPKINFEEIQVQSDGSTRWLQTSKVPLRDPEGQIFGILGTYEDITERKRVEEELRASEERYRTLSEATFEGIVVHADGVIFDVNLAALEQTGYTREEAIGRPILEFFTPDSQEVIKEVFRRSRVEAYEARLITKSGEVRTVQIQARAMDYNGQRAYVTTFMDVTERVEARRQIEELAARKEDERQRLRTILDTLPVGVVIVDESGQVMENNARAHMIWGPGGQAHARERQRVRHADRLVGGYGPAAEGGGLDRGPCDAGEPDHRRRSHRHPAGGRQPGHGDQLGGAAAGAGAGSSAGWWSPRTSPSSGSWSTRPSPPRSGQSCTSTY